MEAIKEDAGKISEHTKVERKWERYELTIYCLCYSFPGCRSVAQSWLTLRLQHARLPCPSPFPGACSNSCPLSPWCHPTVSSSVFPFSSCLLSCPGSESFPVSQLFASGGQSTRASSFSISPSNEYSGLISFRMDWFELLAVQGTLTSLLQHHSSKASILQHAAFFVVQLSHPYITTGKIRILMDLCQQSNISSFQ